jgi:4-alpha-glucanotransferase
VLPINPTGYGNSPYGAISAFAGNPLLISLDTLADWGWIDHQRLAELPGASGNVDYEKVAAIKVPLLQEAARNFVANNRGTGSRQWLQFEQYCLETRDWLNDYVFYTVLRRLHNQRCWHEWPAEFARRDPAALKRFTEEHGEDLAVEQALQFAFEEQWRYLKAYCRDRDIKLMGDVAIFVSYDSADVWTHPNLFELREDMSPIRVSGVPPDYFSADGQRWGNPLYRWHALEQQDFSWWVQRIRRAHELFDMIRLDHFRGFEAFWAIPGEDTTARNGRWVKAPGRALFERLQAVLGHLPFVAEDLGVITRPVDALREEFGFPGMRILQFGFGNRGAHNYLPHRYVPNTVVYTGTHDNDTTLGWWDSGASQAEKEAADAYLHPGDDGIVWAMIRAAATSVADTCLVPVQDVLGLGSEARMNVPSRGDGNWSWRCPPGALTDELARKLAELSEVTDRDHVPAPERDPEPEEFEQEFEQDVEETRAGESDAQAASAHTDAKL